MGWKRGASRRTGRFLILDGKEMAKMIERKGCRREHASDDSSANLAIAIWDLARILVFLLPRHFGRP